jgi:hypothetical protein
MTKEQCLRRLQSKNDASEQFASADSERTAICALEAAQTLQNQEDNQGKYRTKRTRFRQRQPGIAKAGCNTPIMQPLTSEFPPQNCVFSTISVKFDKRFQGS